MAERWLLAILLLLIRGLASAHPMPESLVWIDTTPTGLHITAQIPMNRLGFAFGQDNPLGQQTVLAQGGDALAAYLLQHIGVRSGVGSGAASWQVLRPRLAITGSGTGAELEAVFDVRAPAHNHGARPELVYDIVTHEVRTHRAMVFLRTDWQGGFAGQAPLLLGELRYGRSTLPIVLPPVAGTRGMASIVRLFVTGARHIAEGADHLVFLLMLVLAAPLLARGRRWTGMRARGDALRHLAYVITAFTVGHTVTLVAGSTGWVDVPPPLVEIAVAVTIACAALHAWRPLFAQAEVAMALGFGMIHGLAFSGSLSGAGLTRWQHAQALLAFNLGIETMQLLPVALVLAPLLMLARARPGWFTALRHVLATAAGAASVVWIVQRLGAAGIDVAGADTAPMLVMAALWLVFLGGLGAAEWRAREGRTPDGHTQDRRIEEANRPDKAGRDTFA